jgi:hypothetical protein
MRFLFFNLFLFLTSCSQGVFSSEKSVLEKEKFIEVYEDVLVLENYYQTKYGVPNLFKNALNNSCKKVFLKHDITKQDFEISYDYYAHRPNELKLINEQVITRLNKKKL